MTEMDNVDMDAVERAFEEEERAARRERILDICSGVLTIVGAAAFLALCWLLVREREQARVERRLMEADPAYRLCRRASGTVLALPGDAAE